MPQMAPYNWFNMYLLFNIMYMLLISYIYFMKNVTIKSKMIILKKNYYNWLW